MVERGIGASGCDPRVWQRRDAEQGYPVAFDVYAEC